MADKRIQDKVAIVTPNANSVLAVDDASGGSTRKITVENMADYTLGGANIGGDTSGDIVTIDDHQTLTNKRLTTPSINSSATITATSEEVNILDGVTASTSELNILDGAVVNTNEINSLSGVSSNVQEQLDSKADSSEVIHYIYTSNWTATSTGNETIDDSTIRTALGFSASEYIDWRVNITIGESSVTNQYKQVAAKATVVVTTVGVYNVLDSISVSCTSGNKYYLNIVCTKIST